MPIELYGKKPSSNIGRYYFTNIWNWKPLCNFCNKVFPKLKIKGKLSFRECNALAKILSKEIISGRAKAHIDEYNLYISNIPLIKCQKCIITSSASTCEVCNGYGEYRSIESYYFLSEERLKSFLQFLLDCGGFEIY